MKTGTIFLVIINLVIAVLVFLIRGSLPPEVPLFYGAPAGQDQLVPATFLAIPPLFAAAVSLLNIFFVRFTVDEFLRRLLIGVSILVTILSTITIAKILLLVGNF